jgi:Rieske 2Fe-2S family protein
MTGPVPAINTQNATPLVDLAAGLKKTDQPVGNARTLPARAYTSSEVLELERRVIFEGMWINVCREEDLPNPGDFITRDIHKEKILLLRGKDGAVRAFFNVCRHRGSRLVHEACGGGKLRVSCAYHGWTYEADGKLMSAPYMPKDFCKTDHGLVAVPIGTWNGFVFINLDRHAEPLDQWLTDAPDLAHYRIAELRRGKRVEYTVDANWKLIIENYSECYHCQLMHPQLNRISDWLSGGRSRFGRSFNGGPMWLNEGFTTMSMSGQNTLPVIPGLSEQDHREVNYFTIYPNFLLSPHPDYVLIHTIWPLSPSRTQIVCDWLFTQEALALGDKFDPSDVVQFWDLTNNQDWALCESAQRGAESTGYLPGPYNAEMEACVHAFDRWYAQHMGQHLPG